MSSKTSQILFAINSNSFSFIPLAVNAGLPILIPLVTNGLLVSPGTVFLFTVIPAFPSAASASFPENGLFKNDTNTKWLSVPSLTKSYPLFTNTSANTFAFAFTCFA